MPSTVNLPTSLVQSIADYLSTRPYREVAALLEALVHESRAATASAEPDAAKPDKTVVY